MHLAEHDGGEWHDPAPTTERRFTQSRTPGSSDFLALMRQREPDASKSILARRRALEKRTGCCRRHTT